MKKYLLAVIAIASVLIAGCKKYDDTDLQNKVKDLDARVTALENKLDSNINALDSLKKALDMNDYIYAVETVDGGYKFLFKQGGSVTVYQLVGEGEWTTKQANDGQYYWALNDEFVTDEDGNLYAASGMTPLIIDVEEGDEYITFTLSDGTELKVPVVYSVATIAYVPQFSDKTAPVAVTLEAGASTGEVSIIYKVYPSSAAAGMTTENTKLYATYAATKALAEMVEMPITKITAEENLVEVTASVQNLSEDFFNGIVTAMAGLEYTAEDGNVVCAEYVPLSLENALLEKGWELVTSDYTTNEHITIIKTDAVKGIPVKANRWGTTLADNPWNWEGAYSNIDDSFFMTANVIESGVAAGTYDLEDLTTGATIITIDPAYFTPKAVANGGEAVTVGDAGSFINISGSNTAYDVATYYNGAFLTNTIYWRSNSENEATDVTLMGSYGRNAYLGFYSDGTPEFGMVYYDGGLKKSKVNVMWNDQSEWKWAESTAWDVNCAVAVHPYCYRTGLDDGGNDISYGYAMDNWALLCSDPYGWDPMYGLDWNGYRARTFVGKTSSGNFAIATFEGATLWGAAYYLHHMGWVDVAQMGAGFNEPYTSNLHEYTPTIVIDGNVVTGDASAQAYYALCFDAK